MNVNGKNRCKQMKGGCLTEIALYVEILRKHHFAAAKAVANCRLSMFKYRALSVQV